MLAGELYVANDPELGADHLRVQALLARFNASRTDEDALRLELLRELLGDLGDLGEGAIMKPTLRCDYGYNVAIGARTFVNHDWALLDCNPDRDRGRGPDSIGRPRLHGDAPARRRHPPLGFGVRAARSHRRRCLAWRRGSSARA